MVAPCTSRASSPSRPHRSASSDPVDSSGHFAARYDTSGKISRGTLKVVGRFKSRHSAAGTLNWKVKTRKGNHTCKSGNVHFTAHNP